MYIYFLCFFSLLYCLCLLCWSLGNNNIYNIRTHTSTVHVWFMLVSSCEHYCHYFWWHLFHNAGRLAGDAFKAPWWAFLHWMKYEGLYWDFEVNKTDLKVSKWCLKLKSKKLNNIGFYLIWCLENISQPTRLILRPVMIGKSINQIYELYISW